MSTKDLYDEPEDVVFTEKRTAFDRYNFIRRIQKKNESLEPFYAELVDLALKADSVDRSLIDERHVLSTYAKR